MDIAAMEYDVKKKLNKVDSNQYSNLEIPEIDWSLNEAQLILIKSIAAPRFAREIGLEYNQRSTDDLRLLVVNLQAGVLQSVLPIPEPYYANIPDDYLFYISSSVDTVKGQCTRKLRCYFSQHDDMAMESPFAQPSFDWEEANIQFVNDTIRIFTGGDFIPSIFRLNYLRYPEYMHNADAYGGSYNLPGGQTLTGTQDSELPEHIHHEIVDLAVLLLTGELQINDYNVKLSKINLENGIRR